MVGLLSLYTVFFYMYQNEIENTHTEYSIAYFFRLCKGVGKNCGGYEEFLWEGGFQIVVYRGD